MIQEEKRPLPDQRNAGRRYWVSAANEELVVPQCQACGLVFWYPRTHCPSCGSAALGWSKSSGRGVIHTFTIVRQTSDGFFKQKLPYVVAMVELNEGPRIMTNIVGAGADGAKIGMRVRVKYEVEGEVGIPLFELDPMEELAHER